ncbi:MAG: hypothetical protein QM820_25810 [Minicystis sp.]
MKRIAWSASLGLALACLGASCAHTPEDFCQEWVEAACQAEADCCKAGAVFDPAQCRLTRSQECQLFTEAEGVHAGTFVFDIGAARECVEVIPSCEVLPLSVKAFTQTFAQRKACANAVTGFLPPGAACSADRACARAGEFSMCYSGEATDGLGVCVEVVLDDERCSFSLEDSVLHACPDEMFCDGVAAEPPSSSSPTERLYTFSAPCRPRVAAGQSCIDTRNDSDTLPCLSGLYCHVTGSNIGTCAKQKPAGASCDAHAAFSECEAGLTCTPGATGAEGKCQRPQDTGPFCFEPSKCGDGTCQDDEDVGSCPEDCDMPPDCVSCACSVSLANGGCLDVCTGGTASPNFCDGAPALAQCAACLSANCGAPSCPD